MKITQNLKPWIPGGGRFFNTFILYQLILSYWSVKLQGKGNRHYSFYGLILGCIAPSLFFFLYNKTNEPGPGEGIMILLIAYYSLGLGILFSSIIGFIARKFRATSSLN